ncbi:conserved protein of unknown function [Tepidanaerobacter acetatoxydans Re1]|uniref:Uncharacterized protein n=1 Tax=Tepidanaerobacter acetatoxydans (strain DSM 21804 / JCM 16047 / Re1) TaxID=1209989 RepID=F4LQP2_TEPAE|nr:hypothetical protein [Tepidanaerobacter acetatoxydans]AEE92045.1 hypothetical protein TepRe1_1916 [Tepidanaerobacter acetatoxydans Re1]CDI40881.1 conserved protein of unknown function [Tepidanaerobacter acetatoxydans Re1]
MAKKKIEREKTKNKLIVGQGKLKDESINDNMQEDYELSEELTRNKRSKEQQKKPKEKKM